MGQVPTVLLGYSSTPRSNGTTGLQVPVRCVHVGGGEIVGKTKLWLFVFLVWYLGWVENGVENGNWHPPGFKKSSEGRLV